MPRRISARTVTSSATPQAPATPQQLETPYDSNIHQLRRHWKWAAFSQFFFTFSPLFAMPDVSLTVLSTFTLAHRTSRMISSTSTDQVLSRIMQRLLVTLTQDRKITTDTWQNTLRRQYQRRDPQASPIGLVTRSQHFTVESPRASTPPPAAPTEAPLDELECGDDSLDHRQPTSAPSPDNPHRAASSAGISENNPVTKVEEEDNSSESLEAPEKQPDWLDLSMLAKLESLHTLAEWQFQNPNRIRQQMKTDDEQATWRIEPIGYDAKRNAYWLIGGERLWIQREPPRPNLKRKRKPGENGRKATKEPTQSITTKRLQMDSNTVSVARSPVIRITRGKTQSQRSPGSREGRAAKTRANQRLDAQARDLAEFQRQMVNSRTRAGSTTPRKPTGIRVSARLRGTAVDNDEWQEVPDEWLAESDTRRTLAKDSPSDSLPANKKRVKTGLESDNSSISELTELSEGDDSIEAERDLDRKVVTDMEDTNPASKDNDTNLEGEGEGQLDEEAKSLDPPITPPPPDDFVEWETICVTLGEWESIGQMFEKATHYAERALHKVLSQSIVPMVTAELREIEKKRRTEEAVVHRKRSSRIAMKETEREEERAAMRKRTEEAEKMSRARRLEVRQQKEQAERLRRENMREQRRNERELREQQLAEMQEAESKLVAIDISYSMFLLQSIGTTSAEKKEDLNSNLLQPLGQGKVIPMNGTGSGSRSPVENWELDCEVCGRRGINQDDGVSLLSCGMCGKWQHIVCHDKQDSIVGRPKRNWDAEDFLCRQCLANSKNLSSSSSADLLSLGINNKKIQASSSAAHSTQPSIHPRSYSNDSYYQDSQSNAKYSRNHPDLQTTIPPSSHSYTPQASSAGATFAHYQPQHGGFSTSRPTYTLQDVSSSPQHARYSITPHPVSATGITPYPSTFQTQAITHSSAHVHEQWHSSSYPRTTNSYPINGAQSLHSQGGQPYYNGHVHTSYSHMRGTSSPTPLGRYAGLQHVPSYQHSNSGKLQD
ncbi:hypothetical protein JVU11DRAFT_4249 [Chiua virens]|nr:hypothetical protein JVU11DRAFT_4249 [Chiua virens]